MKKLKEMFAKLKSNRYFQIGAIGLAGVMLVSLLTFVPKVEQVEADTENTNTTTGVMTVDEAKDVALKDANVSDVTMEDVQLDYDDGVQVYDVDFTSDGIEYDYEINAQTGEIIKRETKTVATTTTTTDTTTAITKDKAKTIAMNNAGVTSVSNYTIKTDTEDGVKVYEIEFTSGNYEYDYTIRVSDGKILDVDKEYVGTATISAATAKAKAFAHAGISENQATKVEVELDKGVYEVSFKYNGYEYEYEINGSDGSIINYEKELD